MEIKIVILRTIVRSIAWLVKFYQHSDLKRLRNKCVMTDYSLAELVSVSCGLNPSPAFQAHSAQGRQGHTYRTALQFPLSPQVAREKIRSIGNMKENIFSNMVYSLFTTHHSLIHPDTDFSLFTSHEKQLLGNKEWLFMVNNY